MANLAYFDLLRDENVASWPFPQLSVVLTEAMAFVGNYPIEELRDYAAKLEEAIAGRKELTIYIAREHLVEKLMREGGPELKHYPKGKELSENGIRELLDNWPEDADEEGPLSNPEDLSDLEAMTSLLESSTFENPRHPSDGPGEEVRNADELWALLAMLKVEAALEALGQVGTDRITPTNVSKHRYAWAADLAIEAALAIGEAKARREWMNAELRLKSHDAALPGKRRPPSQRGNNARQEIYGKIEAFVLQSARAARSRNQFDVESFIDRMLVEIPENFTRRRNSVKGNRAGEPLRVKRSTIESYLRKNNLLGD